MWLFDCGVRHCIAMYMEVDTEKVISLLIKNKKSEKVTCRIFFEKKKKRKREQHSLDVLLIKKVFFSGCCGHKRVRMTKWFEKDFVTKKKSIHFSRCLIHSKGMLLHSRLHFSLWFISEIFHENNLGCWQVSHENTFLEYQKVYL